MVTLVDVDDEAWRGPPPAYSLSAHLAAELDDGSRVFLLDDRGFGGRYDPDHVVHRAMAEIEEIARVVVGPDEPVEEETPETNRAFYLGMLTGMLLKEQTVMGKPLEDLQHDVEFSDRARVELAKAGYW